MKTLLPLLISATVLAGCASTAQNGEATIRKDIAVCMEAVKRSDLIAVQVPVADNAISHKIAVASLGIGGSLTVDTLIQMLSKPTRPAIAVVGENDEMSAATLETALKKLPENSQRSRAAVCFAGHKKFEADLRIAAEKAGVNLVLAPNR